jgi:hypothetical protein
MSWNGSGKVDVRLARARARADSLEQVNRVQAAALAAVARSAEELRCLVADLHDDVLSANPMPVRGLRDVTGRMDGLAGTLSRAARGYAGARSSDIVYPELEQDLVRGSWTPRPDRGLDGVLPPIPVQEMGQRRGYARGWHRGPQWITLWFTGPCAFALRREQRARSPRRCRRRARGDHLPAPSVGRPVGHVGRGAAVGA